MTSPEDKARLKAITQEGRAIARQALPTGDGEKQLDALAREVLTIANRSGWYDEPVRGILLGVPFDYIGIFNWARTRAWRKEASK